MRIRILGVVLLAGVLSAGSALAQTSGSSVGDSAADSSSQKDKDFGGFDLGAGLSVTIDFGGIERINSAEVVNGIVRVTDEDDARARIMLESHYFFTPDRVFLGKERGQWGVGPFVAIQPGSEQTIQAAALGIMVGFKRGDTPKSFNIGVGVAVDPNTKTLGNGIERDKPLPIGETEVRYREESQYGLVVLTSFSF